MPPIDSIHRNMSVTIPIAMYESAMEMLLSTAFPVPTASIYCDQLMEMVNRYSITP